MYLWRIGSRRLAAVRLPVSRGSHKAGEPWPAGLTGSIAGVSFNGKQVGYVTDNLVGSFGASTLWFEPIGGHPELIDQETGGAGNVCPPEFVSPVLSGRWLYAYLHAFRLDWLGWFYSKLLPLTNALYALVETYFPSDVKYKIRGAITDDLGQRSIFLLLLTAAVELTLYSAFKLLRTLVAVWKRRRAPAQAPIHTAS